MAEYWNIKDETKDRFDALISEKPDSEMTINFEVVTKDFVNAGKASSEIKMMLKRLGVNPEILRRVAVASYEAEINIAAHSWGGKIICNIYLDCVHVQFLDTGPGIKSIEKALEPGFSTADQLVREMGFGAGLGLPNIKKNSDVMHINSEDGGSTHMEFFIFF